eukprot:TRINITY_DN12891_c0_g2_i1.p1 TRINITY_DN12891_c0_g2~~TRINITY_DN12891_c0_g2_i1.p1  ORF type:complete len:1697 (+),score=261.63 TRINITY_DN12891_c0_g2_i1:49-5139(+)
MAANPACRTMQPMQAKTTSERNRYLSFFGAVSDKLSALTPRSYHPLDSMGEPDVREPKNFTTGRVEETPPLSAEPTREDVLSAALDAGVHGLMRLVQERRELESLNKGSELEELGSWMESKLTKEPENVSLLSLLSSSKRVALQGPGLRPLSYGDLRSAIANAGLCETLGLRPGARVALCVQNGSHLAVAILATVQAECTCCPVDSGASEEELRRDLQHLSVEALLVDSPKGHGRLAAGALGIKCGLLVPEARSAGRFSILLLESGDNSSNGSRDSPGCAGTGKAPDKRHGRPRESRCAASTADPVENTEWSSRLSFTALVLSTSGTTGSKKSVPYSMLTLAVSAACIIRSWELSPEDVCLTMMPLTHVGGIARNLFSVLLSGGRLICFPTFDPAAFWPAVEDEGVTWYYASPTMHRSILEEGARRHRKALQMRMVCNAAGALPSSLARSLRERFNCPVLPSYGMTECMPISSPPVDFGELEPSTSGIPCGPEVSILDDEGYILPAGRIGNIALRGAPLMPGYEQPEANADCWRDNGWFLTGDLGFLSAEGWLQVTGRTKEVIKRGGETLAPLEVEEVVMLHLSDHFIEVAAFAVKDSELGENVALAVVPRPGKPRLGLPRLQSQLLSVLRPQLWPQVLVYCDPEKGRLPRTSTGKLKRAVIAQACTGLTVAQTMPWRARMFDMVSTGGRPIQVLRMTEAILGTSAAEDALKPYFAATRRAKFNDGRLNVIYVIGTQDTSMEKIKHELELLDDFDKPEALVRIDQPEFPEVLPRPKAGDFLFATESYEPPSSKEEKAISSVWADVLQCDQSCISATTDFFEAGGSSLQAGRVASELRKRFGKFVPTHMIFSHPKLKDLAAVIARSSETDADDDTGFEYSPQDSRKPFLRDSEREAMITIQDSRPSSTSPATIVLQLLVPLAVKAAKQVILFASFIVGYRYCNMPPAWPANSLSFIDPDAVEWFEGELIEKIPMHLAYIFGLCSAGISSSVILPCIAILSKWILVGRLQPGGYPIWGCLYLRWWVAHRILDEFGAGIFTWFALLRRLHLRCLGAKVSGTAKFKLSGTTLVEADLIEIGENVTIDGAKLKCASLDAVTGQLVLLPVRVEENASIGFKTVVAPGTTVPADTSLGLQSSSHELEDADDDLRRFNRQLRSEPNVLLRVLIGYPLKLVCWIFSMLPYFVMLNRAVTSDYWVGNEDEWVFKAIIAMTQPTRIVAWIGAQVARDCSSIIYIAMVVIMKWLVVGRFREGPLTNSQWEMFRYWFMDLLLSGRQLVSFSKLVGPHYVIMTIYYRLMGATVGSRIFWPGKPLDLIEYDLLEVGDDVTFGSRSSIRCSDLFGAKKVRILSGAMVADNCTVLPGTVVCESAMLGTGSVANGVYAPDSLAIGNYRNKALMLRGEEVEDPKEIWSSDDDRCSVWKMRPFSRVFYSSGGCGCDTSQSSAPYTVLSWPIITLFNLLLILLWAPVSTAQRWLALLIVRVGLSHAHWVREISDVNVWFIVFAACLCVHFVTLPLSVFTIVGMKWCLIGQRRVGNCSWETSSYLQRWKLFLSCQDVILKKNPIYPFGGSWWMVWYYRTMGSQIGSNVCLYPWGAAPMMTEPDLVTIGNGTCVEAAHLVAHTNVMGSFRLDRLEIGNFCTLRDMTRVVSGGTVMDYSTLKEHSLVMPGEIMPEGSCWQGWPNRWQGVNDLSAEAGWNV